MRQTLVLILLLVASTMAQVGEQEDKKHSDAILNLGTKVGKRNAVLQWNMYPRDPDAIFDLWQMSHNDTSFSEIASGLTLECYQVSNLNRKLNYRFWITWENMKGGGGQSNIVEVKLPPNNPLIFLCPGHYQLRSDQTVKGAFLLITSLASVVASGTLAYLNYYYHQETTDNRNRFQNRLKMNSEDELSSIYQVWKDFYQKENTFKKSSYIAFGTTAALFLFHYIDILIFPRDYRCNSLKMRNQESGSGLHLIPSLSLGNYGFCDNTGVRLDLQVCQ